MAHPRELASDPEWLPHRYLADTDSIRFVHVPRADHGPATFLDDASLGTGRPSADVPVAILLQLTPPPAAGPRFIFHSAFCGSTLLAVLFDRPGVSMGLKEPVILNDLADAALRGRPPGRTLPLVLALLGRPFAAGEVTVVKPSNVANVLLPLVAAVPGARVLLVSSAVDDFLASLARKGLWGRIWARRTYADMAPGWRRDPGFSAGDLFAQSDLQVAALLWLMQRDAFAASLRGSGGLVRSLDAGDLFSHPGATFAAVARHLLPDLPAGAMASGGAALGEHSKERGRAFDPAQRARERDIVRAAHADEIAMVARWIATVGSHLNVAPELPLPLDPAE